MSAIMTIVTMVDPNTDKPLTIGGNWQAFKQDKNHYDTVRELKAAKIRQLRALARSQSRILYIFFGEDGVVCI